MSGSDGTTAALVAGGERDRSGTRARGAAQRGAAQLQLSNTIGTTGRSAARTASRIRADGATLPGLLVGDNGEVRAGGSLAFNADPAADENEQPAGGAALLAALRTLPIPGASTRVTPRRGPLWPAATDLNAAFGLGGT